MSRRYVTLLDGMVLIAAIAGGLAMARLYSATYQAPSPFPFLDWMRGAPSCMIFAIAFALIILWFRLPNCGVRTMLRRPGFIACVAAVMGGTIGATMHVVHILARMVALGHWPSSGTELFNTLWHGAYMLIPFALIGAWITLGASGRWRSDPGWLDRFGRALGIYWIVLTALDVVAPGIGFVFTFFQ